MPGKPVEWSPDEKRGFPSLKRVLLVVIPLTILWTSISLLAAYVQNDDFLRKASVKLGTMNVVEIANDLSMPQFFVPCDDESCASTPRGTHLGDYDLITPGHVQTLHVPIASKNNTVSTYAVFNEHRDRQGCIHVILTKKGGATAKAVLSQSLDQCSPLASGQ